MRVITLNGSDWTTQSDFYDCFFQAIQAPHWHGRNLDALRDSISTGDINKINLPYHIRIRGLETMSNDARELVQRFRHLIEDLEEKRKPVSIELVE